jgi:hypothetical protein
MANNFQLQFRFVRTYDGEILDFEDSSHRNYKTLASAIKSGTKNFNDNNSAQPVVRVEKYYKKDGWRMVEYLRYFAEDGHEFKYGEDYTTYRTQVARVVDRETQEVLWELTA